MEPGMSEPVILPWHSNPQTLAGRAHAEAHRTGFSHAFVSATDDICQIEHQAAAAARAETEALRAYDLHCETFTLNNRSKAGYDLCIQSGRTVDAEYGADLACWPCRIRAALAARDGAPRT
jgi:uncharacterized membrane protein